MRIISLIISIPVSHDPFSNLSITDKTYLVVRHFTKLNFDTFKLSRKVVFLKM